MISDQDQITMWKNELKAYNNQRTSSPWQNFRPNKLITWKDAKIKEVEYNPIVHRYASHQKVSVSIFIFLIIKKEREITKKEKDNIERFMKSKQVKYL